VTAAHKMPSTVPAPANDEDDANEITIERRISATRRTTRLTKVDERLLAIARGELDPDDPFGGLIPIYDEEPTEEVDESWLMLDSGPESTGESEGLFGDIVPALRLPLLGHLSAGRGRRARTRPRASPAPGRRGARGSARPSRASRRGARSC